ncbi:MAG: hypothetical protein L6R00_02695 [Phycisphaerae bacterium]|nr:hypothetical protein [Phycisphaerae bacterium]
MGDGSDIGSRLLANFRETFNEQVQKALARRIHAKVRDARSDPDRAARRWPFELLQNAHDAGPRDGLQGISVTLELDEGVLRFQHDAAPFTMADIAALLTGGSSKDFDSHETTGRFGTGFLVTHALSERVRVSGVLEVEGEHRAFEVALHRPNDEALILRNLKDSESALRDTRRLPDLRGVPTATVEYVVDDIRTAEAGLAAVEDALPHLFGSCRRLRQVTIRAADRERCWRVTSATAVKRTDGIWLDELEVALVDAHAPAVSWRVVRASRGEDAPGRLVFALRQGEDGWAAHRPGPVPSVFRQLPLLGGPTLPTWIIIDGEFDVDQERSSVHVLGEQGRPLREAFAALGGLALLANRERWKQGYRVAHVAMPEGLGEKSSQVWREVLSAAATELSQLPLVSTVREGMLPGVQNEAHDRWVDFISRKSSGPSHVELWELAASCTETDPPLREDSEGWSEIAEGWEALGVSIPWMSLKEIGERAAHGVDGIAELAVDGPPHDWLARYLDAVGKAWRASGITKDHVAGLLPDQHGHLRSAGELRRDGGVSDRVKEISESVGLDIKATLLDNALLESLRRQGLESGIYAIRESTGDELGEDDAIRALVDHLDQRLFADQPVTEKERVAAQATISLLAHLWETKGIQAKETAWRVPILAADGTAQRAGAKRMMVPPVAAWPDAARPFAEAYPEGRVLAQDYAASERVALLDALGAWGVTHRGLLGKAQRDEVADRGLRAIAADPDEVEGAKLRSAELNQIALLEPELINFCKQKRERARALLGLVVCYVAPEDDAWRTTAMLKVRTSEGEKEVEITPCLWLADLRSKPWIPVEDDEDVTHHVPSPELLRELIDTSWLDGNSAGADLLVRHFDMDALDVRLLAAAQDEGTRQRLRDELAKIVEVAGDNPAVIADLAAKAAQRKRDVERMRRLGLAVQARVKAALEELDLDVQVVDRGYDFLVTDVRIREEDPEDLAAYFEVGGYKVEVKATTTEEARLTPLQAETAETDPTAFVLCVVDLRALDGDIHEVDWTTADVSPYCRFVSGAKLPINKTLAFVRSAEGSDVPVRNTTALRYAVQSGQWTNGLDLGRWVQETFRPRS